MNNDNRPHSRRKTVGTGSAKVEKGQQVNTGSRPVGSNARNEKTPGKRSAGSALLNGLINAASGKTGSSSRPSGTSANNPFASRPNGTAACPGNTASRPNGATSRPQSTSSRPTGSLGSALFGGGNASSGNSGSGSASKKGGSKKSLLLILIVVAIIAFFAIKFLGNSGTDGEYESTGSDFGYSDYSTGSSDYDYSYSNSAAVSSNSYSSTYAGTGYSYVTDDYVSDYIVTPAPAVTAKPVATAKPAVVTNSRTVRDRFYTPFNGDTVTIMIYMCGTDLESKSGMATSDLNEIVKAELSDRVNVIIETGGCKQWRNNAVSSSCNQIYKAQQGGLARLESDFGTAPMTDPDNLAKFIQYCGSRYPANRNILIFWDHGGGSISGYGYDEKYPNSGSMTLSKIESALKKGGCKFDFVGFDACLMATLETDLVCSGYADYLVASEETEPGTGWYYTNWLTQLSRNTATPTVELSKTIIDTFVSTCSANSRNPQVTLSVVDLVQLQSSVPESLSNFAVATNSLIQSDDYKLVSNARAGARQFAQSSKLNQVDLIDFAQRIGTGEALSLANTLSSCVKYNRSTISRSNGISMYFPYETTKTVKNAISTFNSLGTDEDYAECLGEYARCVQSFASLEYGGQVTGSASQMAGSSYSTSGWGGLFDALLSAGNSGYGSTSPVEALTGGFSGASSYSNSSAGYGMDLSSIMSLLGGFSGRSMPTDYDWVDTGLIADHAEGIAQNFVDPARMAASEKDGHKVLTLTDEEWGCIQSVELNVFAEDGEGFIDLGLDNTFDYLDDESLLLEYDGTWLTLNGNVCAYYLVSDTQLDDESWVTVGRIPAYLNDMLVNLQVVFDDANPEGVITGAYPLYDDSAIEVQAKGDIPVVEGDNITLLCDYYDLDGNYSSSYTLGSSFTVPAEGLALTNLPIETDGISAMWRLTDVYGNHFWVSAD